jgi:hypothetical protein
MSKQKTEKEKEVIEAFVVHRRETDLPDRVVDRWPDKDNRNSQDIDALAGDLAIEHTSIDTIEFQRRDSDWFTKLADPLEGELGPSLAFRLSICFPYDGVAVGQDWQSMREALKQWIVQEAPSLVDGCHSIQIPGFPFAFDVEKAPARPSGLFFRRYSPDDSTLAELLKALIERKATKLGPYRRDGKTAVLLVESVDPALMNKSKLIEAIRLSFPDGLLDQVDELWYADTSVPSARPIFHELTGE